mgnify:CR=1 FL=1
MDFICKIKEEFGMEENQAENRWEYQKDVDLEIAERERLEKKYES